MNRVKLVYAILISFCVGFTIIVWGIREKKIWRPKSNLKILSDAFEFGGKIPIDYSCDGKNVSPPLRISGVPKRAKSLALVAQNPETETGTWEHWVVFNLPPTATNLPENADIAALGGVVGKNTTYTNKYDGMCPGRVQRSYRFTVYALNVPALELNGKPLGKSAEWHDVLKAMGGSEQEGGHIIAHKDLIGKYERPLSKRRPGTQVFKLKSEAE